MESINNNVFIVKKENIRVIEDDFKIEKKQNILKETEASKLKKNKAKSNAAMGFVFGGSIMFLSIFPTAPRLLLTIGLLFAIIGLCVVILVQYQIIDIEHVEIVLNEYISSYENIYIPFVKMVKDSIEDEGFQIQLSKEEDDYYLMFFKIIDGGIIDCFKYQIDNVCDFENLKDNKIIISFIHKSITDYEDDFSRCFLIDIQLDK